MFLLFCFVEIHGHERPHRKTKESSSRQRFTAQIAMRLQSPGNSCFVSVVTLPVLERLLSGQLNPGERFECHGRPRGCACAQKAESGFLAHWSNRLCFYSSAERVYRCDNHQRPPIVNWNRLTGSRLRSRIDHCHPYRQDSYSDDDNCCPRVPPKSLRSVEDTVSSSATFFPVENPAG